MSRYDNILKLLGRGVKETAEDAERSGMVNRGLQALEHEHLPAPGEALPPTKAGGGLPPELPPEGGPLATQDSKLPVEYEPTMERDVTPKDLSTDVSSGGGGEPPPPEKPLSLNGGVSDPIAANSPEIKNPMLGKIMAGLAATGVGAGLYGLYGGEGDKKL